MPRDICPEMLAHLEAKRESLSDAQYTARRLEIEELIRKHKALEFAWWEQAARWGLVVLALASGVVMSGSPIIAVAWVVACLLIAARWGRHP